MYICNYQRQWELSLDLKLNTDQNVITIQVETIKSYMSWVLSRAERMKKCSSFFPGYQTSVTLRKQFAQSSYRTTSTLQPTPSSSFYLTALFLRRCLRKNGEKQFSNHEEWQSWGKQAWIWEWNICSFTVDNERNKDTGKQGHLSLWHYRLLSLIYSQRW